MTHEKGLTPRKAPRVLRVAIDRATVLYERPIDSTHAATLQAMDRVVIPTDGGSLVLDRHGKASRSELCVWSGDGLYLAMRSGPSTAVQGIYPLKVEAQGLLCSTATTGLSAVHAILPSVERLIYPQSFETLESKPGMFDVLADVEVDDSEWIERVLFGNGNVDVAASSWCTRGDERSRKLTHTQVVGAAARGRTLYYGRNPKLRVYEKDRECQYGGAKGTGSRDGELVKARWRDAGWDGKARVVRAEWSATREWITSANFETHDGAKIPGSSLSWEAFWPLLPVAALTLWNRYRHVELNATRRERCSTSQWWECVRDAFRVWDAAHGTWEGVVRMKTIQREAFRQRAMRKVELGLTDLQAMEPASTLREIAIEVTNALDEQAHDSPEFIARHRRQQRLQEKLGM